MVTADSAGLPNGQISEPEIPDPFKDWNEEEKKLKDEWGKFRVEIKAKKGEWLENKFPAHKGKKVVRTMRTTGITPDESSDAMLTLTEASGHKPFRELKK